MPGNGLGIPIRSLVQQVSQSGKYSYNTHLGVLEQSIRQSFNDVIQPKLSRSLEGKSMSLIVYESKIKKIIHIFNGIFLIERFKDNYFFRKFH